MRGSGVVGQSDLLADLDSDTATGHNVSTSWQFTGSSAPLPLGIPPGDRVLSCLIACTKPYHCYSMCITTGWRPFSGRINSKWNMTTIISLADITIGSEILNGASVAEWCCSCKAFVWHAMTVAASVDLIQFSFQLPVVYYHHSHWYCGINHQKGPRGYSGQEPNWVMQSCVLSAPCLT